MKLIVGLGNPGSQYERTRHNVGFLVVDQLARQLGVGGWRGWMNSLVAKTAIGDTPVLLAKPLTFMNLSGEAVQPLLRFYRAEPGDLLVVHDDLDLPERTMRLRACGGAGGHRGMQSIITTVGDPKVARVRIGIGRPPKGVTAAEYVLQQLGPGELAAYEDVFLLAVAAAKTWALEGMDAAMNKYNRSMP